MPGIEIDVNDFLAKGREGTQLVNFLLELPMKKLLPLPQLPNKPMASGGCTSIYAMMDASASTSALIFRSSVISDVATSLMISEIVFGLKYGLLEDGVRVISV